MSALIRVSVLKESDASLKDRLATTLAPRLRTTPDRALRFPIVSPSRDEVDRLIAVCTAAGQEVYDQTDRIPALELVEYDPNGMGRTTWRFVPRRRTRATDATD